MELTSDQLIEIKLLVKDSLDQADSSWLKVGQLFKIAAESQLQEAASLAEKANIPGYPLVRDGVPKVDKFIALVVDMRDSTEHMVRSDQPLTKTGFERVYFETTALLPALSKTISFFNGQVTEYLGDGVLALFQVIDVHKSIISSFSAAHACLNETLSVVNDALHKRYELPPLAIGAGLSIGRALVTLVGYPGSRQAKAVGEIVWQASNLSGGNNEIQVCAGMRKLWPTSPSGRIYFVRLEDEEGYRIDMD